MNSKKLWVVFLAGIIAGTLWTVMLAVQPAFASPYPKSQPGRDASPWPDSLDAVVADPAHHKIVFENSKVRILEVIGSPFTVEPVHTHRWPSVMWAADDNFSRASLVYYHCGYDAVNKRFYITDSVAEHGPPPNRGFEIPAEGPHRVTNLSEKQLIAYRVEFKN